MKFGKYDEPGSMGPSPYYDALRVYNKIYDKLAPNLDLDSSQLSLKMPNIIALSICTPVGNPSNLDFGIKWAIEELFSLKPRSKPIELENGPTIIDISLDKWLNHKANDLIKEKKLDAAEYRRNYNAVSYTHLTLPTKA